MGEGVAYGCLPVPGMCCPASNVGHNYGVWNYWYSGLLNCPYNNLQICHTMRLWVEHGGWELLQLFTGLGIVFCLFVCVCMCVCFIVVVVVVVVVFVCLFVCLFVCGLFFVCWLVGWFLFSFFFICLFFVCFCFWGEGWCVALFCCRKLTTCPCMTIQFGQNYSK